MIVGQNNGLKNLIIKNRQQLTALLRQANKRTGRAQARHPLWLINMKNYLIILLFLITLIISCKPIGQANKTKGKTNIPNVSNNQVTVQGINTLDMATNNKTKIIFDGKDNHLVFNYLNSFFNSKNKKDVIIIEGNGNIVHITHNGVIDNSSNSKDTILIQGNYNYLELLNQYVLDNSTSSDWNAFIKLNEEITIIKYNELVIISDSTEIENKMTNELMEFRDVYKYYLYEANNGNPTAAFYMGELYYVGLGVEYNPSTAVFYYLIAANKGNVDAQSVLGYIYANNFEGIEKDLKKAKYWYEKAAQNGNHFAIEQLKKINQE